MDKVLEALERLKTAPTFMGGTPEYQACTKSETLLMQDYETVKQFILKEQEKESGRLPNKELICLKQTIEQCNDKPMFYISETYGNKYIVPQKQFDDLTKVLDIIKEKKVNIGTFYHVVFILKASYEACKLNNGNVIFNICDTRKEFLTLEEFDMLKEWLNGFKPSGEVISRSALCEAIRRIFGSEEKFLDIIEEDLPYGYHYCADKNDGEEIYVSDVKHRQYIHWYKLTHIGRDFNTDMKTKEEVIDFLQRLHDEWLKENEDE